MRPDLLKGHLDLLLLSIISEAPAHGYAIIDQLHRRSEEAFALPEGTVYPALHRLEDAGFVASTTSRVDGRSRRTYALTGDGRHALAERRQEWLIFKGAINAVLGEQV